MPLPFLYVPSGDEARREARVSTSAEMTIDPVCGRQIGKYQAAACVAWQGVWYHFCSESCHKSFTSNLHSHSP